MGDDAGYSASELARRLKPGKRADRPFQTPGDVFEFWFSDSATNPVTLARKHKIWFGGGAAIDRLIARRGLDLIAKLASGEAWLWANKGPAERLAAIIALDQFTRNVFRDTPAMFENDAQALELCKTGLALGEDKALSPLKRWFFYMPLEHSESLDDQERCVDLFEDLAEAADEAVAPMIRSALDYARRHRDVIEAYGRFPHRNAILDRCSTDEELQYLSKPGAGF